MTRRKSEDTDPAEGSSPAIEAIDPRQVEIAGLTATPDEEDVRVGWQPDAKDNPYGPDDVSNVVDPDDPMTLTGEDAKPGESGE